MFFCMLKFIRTIINLLIYLSEQINYRQNNKHNGGKYQLFFMVFHRFSHALYTLLNALTNVGSSLLV